MYDAEGVVIGKFKRKYQAIIFRQKKAGELHRMSIAVGMAKNEK